MKGLRRTVRPALSSRLRVGGGQEALRTGVDREVRVNGEPFVVMALQHNGGATEALDLHARRRAERVREGVIAGWIERRDIHPTARFR